MTTTTTTATPGAAAALDWTTYGHDAARSDAASGGPPAATLASRWTAHLDGAVYGQPLVADGEVIVATEDDTVYALDATTGAVRWTHHLATPVDGSTLQCGNINPSGITSTPVVDPTSGTVFVLAFQTQPSGAPAHHLYGLALTTGAVTSDRDADVAGLDPALEQQRGALSLTGGRVVVVYGGLDGDCGHYRGAVASLPAGGDGSPTTFTIPTAREGGIWAPPGPVVGPGGRILVTTGNAASRSIYDDANAVIALSPALRPVDLFAPTNWEQLSADDLDLSSTTPAVLGDGRLVVGGKQGVAYLLDGTHLGGVGGQQSSVTVCPGAGVFGGTAVSGQTAFLPCRDGVHAVTAAANALRTTWTLSHADPGTPVLAGGTLYDLARDGTLLAVDPRTGAVRQKLQLGGTSTSFPGISAANGWLYAPTGHTLTALSGA